MTNLEHLLKYKENLQRRDFLLDMLTICTRTELTGPIEDGSVPQISGIDLYKGQIVSVSNKIFGVEDIGEGRVYLTPLESSPNEALLSLYTIFKATKDHSPTIKSPIETSVGRFILNYLLLEIPFGDIFTFINAEFKVGSIENAIVEKILTKSVSREQVQTYINNIYFIGSFTELCVPSISAKSLTTGEEVEKRREELYAQYADELDNPVIQTKIENELIAMDMQYLKDDESFGFYIPNKSKAFDVARKRMLLTGGMVNDFDGKAGKFSFVKNPLDTGWDIEDFPVLFNDIRQGVYNRAMNTAKGGEQSKFLSRVFQDSQIVEEDCKTGRGLTVTLTEEVIDLYLYRYIVTASGLVVLDKDNRSKFLNKTVKIRSPQYCETKNGYCYTCMGELFKSLGSEAMSMNTVGIGSAFLMASMKAMHGVKTNINDISKLDNFVIRAT